VHAAAATKAADGVCLAPALHRLRPLLGDVVLRESLQGANELAVHQPGRKRIEIPGDCRHSNFVEQRQTFLDFAVEDAQPSCRHSSDGARRRLAPRAHRDGALGPLPSALEVAGQHPLVRADRREPRVRGRLLLTLEQPFCSAEPAAHRRHERGVQEQVHRHANRCTCRRGSVAGLCRQRVRALPRLDGHVEMAGGVSDLAEQLQIARICKAVRVGLHQQVVGLLPTSARRRLSRALDAHCTPP
jgi:hypothetical protein